MKTEPLCSPLAVHKHSAKEQRKADQPSQVKPPVSLPAKKAATWNDRDVAIATLAIAVPAIAVFAISLLAYQHYEYTRPVNIGPLPADVANNTAYSTLITKTVDACNASIYPKRICERFLADAVLNNSLKGQTDLGHLFLSTSVKNDALAFEWMKKAAAQDSDLAYYSVSLLFETPEGHAVLEWLEKQAEAGSPTARQVLFKSVYPVNGCEKLISPEKARQYVESQADTGDVDALYQSAQNHLAAHSKDKALARLKKAVELTGDVRCRELLAEIHPDARQRFLEVAILAPKSDKYRFRLAEMVLDGVGVPSDAKRAAGMFKTLAATKNHVQAYTKLAELYDQGKGPVPQDLILAAEYRAKAQSLLLKVAADAGLVNAPHPSAQNHLAAENLEKAVEQLTREFQESRNLVDEPLLAKMDPNARKQYMDNAYLRVWLLAQSSDKYQFKLAEMNLKGTGVPVNVARAVDMFRTLADQKNSLLACAKLAKLYAEESGPVPQNLHLAAEYSDKAHKLLSREVIKR